MNRLHALLHHRRLPDALLALSFGLMAGTLYLIFMYVPTEESMGIVQRIFYFHVPIAWVASLAFFIVFVCSIGYLATRTQGWDRVAYCAGEIGVLFTTLVLITGSLWAKPAWGTWWEWEPRLTTSLVLWLIYLAYILVRSYAADSTQGARFAAVVGIVGFIDVPIVFLAIRWWRTLHPSPVVFEGGSLTGAMRLTLMISLASFTLLFAHLLLRRVQVRRLADEVELLSQEIEEREEL